MGLLRVFSSVTLVEATWLPLMSRLTAWLLTALLMLCFLFLRQNPGLWLISAEALGLGCL